MRDSAGDSVGQSVGQANPTVDGGASGVTGGALYRGVPSGVVQAAQVAIVSNVTREYACALQVVWDVVVVVVVVWCDGEGCVCV